MTGELVTEMTTLRQHAETIRNDAPHDLRGVIEVGDAWAQGDLLVRRMRRIPPGVLPVERQPQLAPGDTQGSRHRLSSLRRVSMFRLVSPTALDGPLFRTRQDVTITHPEHGHVTLPPGVYHIQYQRASGSDVRRALD